MRKPIMAGNWKMYKTYDEALKFIYEVNNKLPNKDVVETIIFPPAMLLVSLVKRQGDNLEIGAQNMHYENCGAYTGEISAEMLRTVGVTHVLVGHNERRRYFAESDEDVNKKAQQALEHSLSPVICFGETEEQYLHHNTDNILRRQVHAALIGLPEDKMDKVILAYEPIWAVGTGKTATPEIANEKCKLIRSFVEELYGKDTANNMRILYGGSVNPDNIKSLVDQPDVDGALVGGASLDSSKFIDMAFKVANQK
ncbi:MAG: triose-phosphate isomerase [Acholeplasmatales bacterium]|nr:triose-phosphate isomerase [Acholeplasmatales bacterium]